MGNTTNIYCREGGLEPELDLFFGDLPSFLDREPEPRTCYHGDQEQRNSFSSQDFFEFSPPDDQSTKTNPPRDIIFFGRDILNKTKQSANSPDPFIYGTDSRNPVNRLPHLLSRSIETSKPSRAPNSTGSFRDHLSSDSSRKHKVLIGLAKVPSKMELSDIKKRQSRQAPAPMIPAAMLAGDEKRLLMGFDRSGKGNQKGRGEFAKPLKCRTYLSGSSASNCFKGCIPLLLSGRHRPCT